VGADVAPLPPPCAQEAVRYYNRTAAQKKMLEFARQYLQADDEVGDDYFWGLLLGVLCGWGLWVPQGGTPPCGCGVGVCP